MNVLAHEVKRSPANDDTQQKTVLKLSASTLCHNDVYNHKEQKLGKIDNLIIRLPAGELTFAIMSNGGFWGIGERLLAVPWQALVLDRNLKRFVLPLSVERLERAPSFESHEWPDMDDPLWATEIHSFYGIGHAMPQQRSVTEKGTALGHE
ncbi:PRC-barrel domain-containing protein [Bowmanella yangjiangensis]|uniref:PRC-barrel domain-containing protein n=1 Tax=Bowmanella yangjiangensis TaxID=2811230 RepID=A0ABS3CMR5_9ALTE|nr:PRC-barrel domain-containing protein [Bowmanella yangjiangensis]MBN7818389.1 PRC-barrel domain-containing protein [Bowmanella yangjiangensis]